MSYTLYYQKRNGDKVIITRSKSLLKLLKIKLITYGFDTRAFIVADREQYDKYNLSYDERTQYNKFDLSYDERTQYNDFEKKVNTGRYFASYDYKRR